MPNIIFYRCNICGNVLALLKKSGSPQTCCDKSMTKLEPNSTDGAKEKHIPVVIKENDNLHVSVGSTLHPMLPEHYIEWIALDNGDKTEIVYLKPGMEPKAEFAEVKAGTVYEYCNLHGLWKADF